MPVDVLEPGEGGWPARSFSLRGRAGVITLDDRGIHHPGSPRSHSFTFTRYEDLIHVAVSPRAIWLGARRSVYVLPRNLFADEQAPDVLVRCLLAGVERLPDGDRRLAHMLELEEWGRVEHPCRATWGLALACLLVFAAQLWVGDLVEDAGFFGVPFLRDGDWWRAVTTHFLHAAPSFPLHLVLNLLGLVAFGTLAERPLGTPGTLVVMGGSALGADAAAWIAGYGHVVGVSGVVYGLVGAVTWLELRETARLPAWWRVPRAALYFMLAASAVLPLVLPFIAGASHLGGLLGGVLVTALLRRRVSEGRPYPAAWVRPVAASIVVVCAVALVVAGLRLRDEDHYFAQRLEQAGRIPEVEPEELNWLAWMVALKTEATEEQREAALGLAERAVEESERKVPEFLDTLAELQFQLGEEAKAIATIDEAIQVEPEESYYQEQRRRFLGERAFEDRPPPPEAPGPSAPDPEPPARPIDDLTA